ncbi:hypothetical protein D3P07_20175 [Paenibacillus sp. 1011MAR3C5]|uniref:hypothetical protein n=1 Tax=Paenibacillus sp. 1011MAR3C5 TaxID=1675787 RepID=UPI000E6C905C|nr:hypothetical protein [Paenibacillus sp. 1011MAR3C5]RJE85523.1 hypothetical protein D3P07_20175 [Paenibacillus sp. 1011MAR3C5]
MTKYNVDLERALRERPVPGKQVSISVESILAPRNRTGAWRKRIAYAFAACVVAISVVFLSRDMWLSGSDGGSALPIEGYHASNNEDNWTPATKEKAATALGELQPDYQLGPQLAELDWNGLLEGKTKLDGMEMLYREVLDEDSQLLFMARKGGVDYAYELLAVEVKKDGNEPYKVSTTFSAIPLKGPKTYEEQADNDWMTYNWGSYRHEDGRTIRFAFGYVLNERLTEVRFANSSGKQETALQLSHSGGQRFWFKVLSPELSEGAITIEALNSLTGRLMLVDTEGRIKQRYSRSLQNMDSFSALSQKEWREISDGAVNHPYIEMLDKKIMQDGSQMLFLADYNKSTPVKGYKMYVVNLTEEKNDESNRILLPAIMGVSAALEYDSHSTVSTGNAFFHYSWGAMDKYAFVFGFIRDPEVEKLQLKDSEGVKIDLVLTANKQGDRFFVHYDPRNKEEDTFDYTFEALDRDGNVMYPK